MTNEAKKNYVGIDVSKQILDIYILPGQTHYSFTNDKKGMKQLLNQLERLSDISVVMEATGGYEKLVSSELKKQGFSVCVVNPRQIRDFAKALGKLAKTDKIDAQVIALFAERIQPQPSLSLNENLEELAELNTRRRQLIDMITMEKNRRDKVSSDGKKSIERILKVLEKELVSINEKQETLIKQDNHYAQIYRLLLTVKGIGSIVAAALIANLPELGQLSAKQITALAGLAPFNRDSGTLRGKRTIWGGRAPVRCAMYMATLVAIRYNEKIKAFYQHLRSAGKLKKVAIIACMRKLLICLNAMIKNNQPWHIC